MSKTMTLRQQLREQAGSELDVLRNKAIDAVAKIAPANISTQNLLRLACNGRVAALREKMITRLANEAEHKLIALYNKQEGLPLEDSHGTANTGD